MVSTEQPSEPRHPQLTVIIVSYNTRELTLQSIRTLLEHTNSVDFDLVVYDNASSDQSAEAIEEEFPDIRLIKSDENVGFAKANNIVADQAQTEWILLLNPDTETHSSAVDNLYNFAVANPEGGIYGGRTVFPDGSLNIASCWNQITPWSVFCRAVGLSTFFSRTALFDTEAIGSWQRDTVRNVDIVVGCFLMVRKETWDKLGGFDTTFWMYGEEADLCLRAKKLGFSPMITPDATIMHLVGAANTSRADKIILVAKARASLIKRHWPTTWQFWGMSMMWLWCANRMAASSVLVLLSPNRFKASAERWKKVWQKRNEWLEGY